MGGINGIAIARITYGIRVHAASLVFAAQVCARNSNGGNGGGNGSSSDLAAKLVEQERGALQEIVCEKCREEGKGQVGRWCEFEALRERKQCEECLTAGREKMVELLQDRNGPANFLASYGLCVVTWPEGNDVDLEIDLNDFTFDDEEEVAADALNPLLPVTLELLPSSPSSSSSSSSSTLATFPHLEAWSLADGPTATASAAIDLDKVKELDERAEAFARFLQETGVSLVDVEEEGKPRMRVELESRVQY